MKQQPSGRLHRLLSRPCIAVAALAVASIPSLSAGTLFEENFENPVISGYEQGITPERWVRASSGFNSGYHGLVNKDTEEFDAPSGNDQAYAFRYTNSGLTTAEGLLGPPLASGGGYEVSFDVVLDGGLNAGTPYTAQLIAFAAGAIRHDVRSTPADSAVLASATGNAPADGSFASITLSFSPNDVTHAAHFGKDLGIRFKGSTTSAIIDNVSFRVIPGPGPDLDLVGTTPIDGESQILTFSPLRAVFTKDIAAATGDIIIRDLTAMIDHAIPVTDPRVSVSGVLMEIDAGDVLEYGKDYAILIDAGAIIESPGGASFTGIADELTWNFTTADGDFLFYSISQLKDHINGVITLTAAEIDTIKKNLDKVIGRFAESTESITALFDLVATYESKLGPLFVARGLPNRDKVTNDLHWTIYNVMQNIMDRIYTADVLAAHEALLDGYQFAAHAKFPGPCPEPADPLNSHTVQINGGFPITFGRETQQWSLSARKPTGTYLAPGTIATVTVPPGMVNAGFLVRVGAHSWNLGGRNPIQRLERISRTYPITSENVKVANPLGGGIYIEVPIGADLGVVNVTVTGAVRAPYFSAKSFHQTTPAEWLIERAHPAPWADFQSDKFMTQVPTQWIYAHPDPAQLMTDWDAAMDAINDLMGFPRDRGKETMYCQVDIIMRSSVHAPGYPAVNVTDNPNNNRGGYHNNYLVRGPGASATAAHIEFHEQGHAYKFPKFDGESESNVNLLQPAMLHRKFGYSMDVAQRASLGSGNANRTMDNTAVAWMCVFNFSPREVPMATAEKAYQHKGHAKFLDIARLFGWEGMDAYWRSFMEDDANGISYTTGTDAYLLRLSRHVGRDIRPLFHFWGIHPQNPANLAASIAAENIPASVEIRNLLLRYKSIIPADNAAFRTFAQAWWGKQPSINGYWEEREHARQWDTTALYGAGDQQRSEATNPGEIYNENSANDIRNRVDELVALYFPGGITPAEMSFASAPVPLDAATIGMTATTATAPVGPVEYRFENTTTGAIRDWGVGETWNQTGLAAGQTYTYRVRARNGLGEETAWSPSLDATIAPTGTPFQLWTEYYAELTDSSPSLDFDNGGLATALEWVLGGNPADASDDAGLVPTLDSASDLQGKLRFTYRRTIAADADPATTIQVQYGSDLDGWTEAEHQGTAADQITIIGLVDGFGPGIDRITVALPASLAASGRLFARLRVLVEQP